MTLTHWSYSDLLPDGSFSGDPMHQRGSVRPQPEIATSGNHWHQTPSLLADDEYWMSISTGRLPDGTMHGITLGFECEDEMRLFEQTRTVRGYLEY